MTRVKVNVTYHEGVGYVSVANHKVTRSLAALSLEGLRRKVIVVTALRRRAGEEVSVVLELDPSARAELARRAQMGVSP